MSFLSLVLVFEFDVRLKIEFQVVEDVITHMHLFKEVTVFHKVYVGKFIRATV